MTIEQLAYALNQLRLEQSYGALPTTSGHWAEMSDWRKEEWRKAARRFLALTASF